MSTLIICPNCKTQFEPEAAIAQSVEERVRKEFNEKWVELAKQKDEQFGLEKKQWLQQQKDRERAWEKEQEALARRQQEEKKEFENRVKQELAEKVRTDFENQLQLLQDVNKTNEAKLKEAREKELDFLKKMQELKTREQEQ
jgi:predicted GH43/DUF377 family glycosyl hydrolase